MVPLLWRRWSPGIAEEDLRHVDAAIGTPEGRQAAQKPYRAPCTQHRAPADYADESAVDRARSCSSVPAGHDDGCAIGIHSLDGKGVCPPAVVAVVEHAGHFLQLEQPDKIAELIVAFIGSPG